MVVPHQVGDIIRSFVRVPGSGSERSANPVLCDLARASTLAATVPIPQNPPPATHVLTQIPCPYSNTQIPNNQKRKRDKIEEKENIHKANVAPKVICIETSTETIPIKTIPVTLMAAVRIPNVDVLKLKNENKQLRMENENLRKQLSLFKQLIRNPERLQRVLRRLEKKTQEA